MEKIRINPNRLQWCCDVLEINIENLYKDIGVAESTLNRVMKNEAALSVKQLEKIASFFNRSLLFFLESSNVIEEKIYSPQFRTINNQKPIHSRKLRALIERVERQRKIYLGLLEDLDEKISQNWQLKVPAEDAKKSADIVRKWLNLSEKNSFCDLRNAIESKGIMVFVTNGYNGKWQIDKKNPVRGFSLYYNSLPIIVIKKQSHGAQAFTLFHELAHLLLHKESMIDNEEDLHSYQGKEKEANEFSGSVLIPDIFLNQINLERLLDLEIEEYDEFLKKFKNNWCVSGEAILVRLLKNNKITQVSYHKYRAFKQAQIERQSNQKSTSIPRSFRNREPLNIFGRPFVNTVLDALYSKNITLAKASTYLDNLTIKDLHKLEDHLV